MSQLEEVARQMYAGERADAIQNAQLAWEYSDSNYQRYLDRLAQYNTDRSFGFGVLSDVLDRSFQREQWKNTLAQQEYQKERDALSDQRYADETAYGRGLDAWSQEQSESQTEYQKQLAAAETLYNETGDASALGSIYGYSPEQIAAMESVWVPKGQTVGNLYTTANIDPNPEPEPETDGAPGYADGPGMTSRNFASVRQTIAGFATEGDLDAAERYIKQYWPTLNARQKQTLAEMVKPYGFDLSEE